MVLGVGPRHACQPYVARDFHGGDDQGSLVRAFQMQEECFVMATAGPSLLVLIVEIAMDILDGRVSDLDDQQCLATLVCSHEALPVPSSEPLGLRL